MRIYEAPGTLKKFRKTAWEFQVTFHTPLKELAPFVEVIMSALPGTQAATAVIEQMVFEPRYGLAALFEKHSIGPLSRPPDVTIEAPNAAEAREVLQALLSEWADFLFVPAPKPFVIYADHHEYITFLSHRKSGLTAVVAALEAGKFTRVDYVRRW